MPRHQQPRHRILLPDPLVYRNSQASACQNHLEVMLKGNMLIMDVRSRSSSSRSRDSTVIGRWSTAQ